MSSCAKAVASSSRGWALNEASLEKGPRLGVLGVVVEIDGRPVSTFGCDGVLVSTPTGSTAYAFSAGGPVLWPDLEAILVVPNNAHALFGRPMVTSPDANDRDRDRGERPRRAGVLRRPPRNADTGRRRLEVTRCATPVKWARLDSAPFTDRLVRKFRLPVTGWRGTVMAVRTEIRIESLGAISVATAEFDRGLTVLTGETGTGKTMVVTGLHLLGGARADATRVRSGADRAVVEGRFTTTDLDDAAGCTARRDARRVRGQSATRTAA